MNRLRSSSSGCRALEPHWSSRFCRLIPRLAQPVSCHSGMSGAVPGSERSDEAKLPASSSAVGLSAIVEKCGTGAARVTDKMPLNFQWAGLLHMALPRATMIHCRRSPLDTALSIHQTHFNPAHVVSDRRARRSSAICAPTSDSVLTGARVMPPQRFIESGLRSAGRCARASHSAHL